MRRPRVGVLAVLVLALFTSRFAPAQREHRPGPLGEEERAAIAETLRGLARESSATFDSDLACEEIVERMPVAEGSTVASGGRMMTIGDKAQRVGMCRAVKRERAAAHEEVEEQVVEVLSREAAVVVTSGTYSVTYRDGRRTDREQVVTTVWALRPEGWRMVHLHESWPATSEGAVGSEEGSGGGKVPGT